MQPYSYSALDSPHSFRLLHFTQNSEETVQINCAIDVFQRGSDYCPPYTALSYAWGDVQTTVPVTLNGQRAYITENLQQALLHLRHIRPNALLWVDALCINQDDATERGHQVSQMRAIYSDASNVISWLGQGTRETSRLFAFIRKHHYACTIHGEAAEYCEFTADRELADGIRYLEERPYWTRIWIIQEIVVASNLEVMCGDESVSWSIFVKFWPLIFENHFKKTQGMNRRLGPPAHASAILPLISWRRTNIKLSYALELTGLSRASDDRDKVYALLGLVDEGTGQDIVIDYTIPPCRLFMTATQAVIQDWNNADCDMRHRLRDMLPQLDIQPTSRQRFKKHNTREPISPVPQCYTVHYLRQHVRALLGYSDEIDIVLDVFPGTEDCDGETCGSWAAMYKAATIHKDFKGT
jgi:hypothetical protein